MFINPLGIPCVTPLHLTPNYPPSRHLRHRRVWRCRPFHWRSWNDARILYRRFGRRRQREAGKGKACVINACYVTHHCLFARVCMFVYARVCLYMCECVCMRVCMCVCIRVYVCVCVCILMCVCVCVYLYVRVLIGSDWKCSKLILEPKYLNI